MNGKRFSVPSLHGPVHDGMETARAARSVGMADDQGRFSRRFLWRDDPDDAGMADPVRDHLGHPVREWQMPPMPWEYTDKDMFMRDIEKYWEDCKMFEPVENGMVVGAEREFDRMYGDTPYDSAEFPQMESYLFDTEKVGEFVEGMCGLESGDMTEDVAVLVYDHLDKSELLTAVRNWFRKQDAGTYNEWWAARNNMEDN